MAREKFPSDDVDRLMLRFPAGMRDRIAAAAKANNRSMNSEIVARLESSLVQTPDGAKIDFGKYAEGIAKNAALEAAARAIDIVLSAMAAPIGTSDGERFRMIVRKTNEEIQADKNRALIEGDKDSADPAERTKPKPD